MISGLYDAITGKRKTSNYGGLGDYGTYTGQDGTAINVNEDAYNALKVGGVGDGTLSKTPDSGIGSTISRWFTPGEGGASLGGNVLSGVGTAVGIGSGLAGMYFAKKEADLKKDKAQMEKDAYQRGVQREAEAENRMQQFAKNAGNGAFYK